MDVKLKQRFVGAVVLTALAVIVLPMILDGSLEDREKVIASMPQPPKVALKKLRVDAVRAKMEAMERESAAQLPQPAPEASQDTAGESDAPDYALDNDNLPVSWTLQVASFKDRDKAESLRGSLRDAEYRSYILQANTDGGETFRVFVGPVLKKQRLQAISEEIESRFELKGLIVRYKVEDDSGQLGG